MPSEAERFRNRVQARHGPRSATQQSAQREVAPPCGPVRRQRLCRVTTAAGVEPADRGHIGGDEPAIEANRQQQDPGRRRRLLHVGRVIVLGRPWVDSILCTHTAGPLSWLVGSGTSSRRNAASRSEASSALLAVAAAGNALITNAVPRGTVPKRGLIRCRSWRVTRWRTTELPTALLTTKPAFADSSYPNSACTTRRRRLARTPPRITARKSTLRRKRASAGSTQRLVCRLLVCQPESR